MSKKSNKPAVAKARSAHRIAKHYEEIPSGDGVMRAEAGDHIFTDADGVVTIKPPSLVD